MKCYVVEEGQYDYQHVELIATSLERAVSGLKELYSESYIVTWDELKEIIGPGRSVWGLHADFDYVQGLSTKHWKDFVITEYELLT